MSTSLNSGGLPAHAVARIGAVLARYPVIERAILFGSRAKGNHKRGSDIDLALVGPVAYDQILGLATDLDDLLLPWEIDLVPIETISNPDLLEHITRVGQVFYSKLEMAA